MLDKFSIFYLTTLGVSPAVMKQEPEEAPVSSIPASWLDEEETSEEAAPVPETAPESSVPASWLDEEEVPDSWKDSEEFALQEPSVKAPPAKTPTSEVPSSWLESGEKAPESNGPPSWYDPSWLEMMPGHNEEEYDEEFAGSIPDFEDFEIKTFPRTRTKKESPKKVDQESKPESESEWVDSEVESIPESVKPEAKFDGGDFEDARDYLLSFNDDPAFSTVIDAISQITKLEDTKRSNRSQKTIANALGFVIGALESLITKVDLGEKKDDVVRAATIVKDFYAQAVGKLNPELQEKVNNRIVRQVEGPKERPLQKFWSQWYSPDVVYVRNRAIIINRNEGTPFIQAEEQAEKEFIRMNEIVDAATNFSQADRDYLRTLFARMVLGSNLLEGGEDFDNAAKYIQGLIARGPNKDEEKFYQDVDTDLDSEDVFGMAKDLANEGELDIGEELEDIGLPQDEIDNLASKIEEFGKNALNLLKLGMDWEERASKGLLPPEEVTEAAQDLYNRVTALGSEISTLPQDVKVKAYNDGEIFKTIYAVASNVENYTGVFGIDTIETTDGTGRQLVEEDLTFFDPIAKPPTEEEKERGFRKKRVRNPEVEKAAKERYMERVERSGQGEAYKKVRRVRSGLKEPTVVGRGEAKHHEKDTEGEFEHRKNLQKEYNKVVNSDQGTTYKERDRWKAAPFSDDVDTEIKKIESYQYNSIKHFWHQLLRSFLADTEETAGVNPHTKAEEFRTKERIASVRKNDRTNKLNETLAELETANKERPNKNIQKVIAAMKLNILKFDDVWEAARDEEIAASMRPSSIRRPGEWTNKLIQQRREKERKARDKKVSSITLLSDIFYKMATSHDYFMS